MFGQPGSLQTLFMERPPGHPIAALHRSPSGTRRRASGVPSLGRRLAFAWEFWRIPGKAFPFGTPSSWSRDGAYVVHAPDIQTRAPLRCGKRLHHAQTLPLGDYRSAQSLPAYAPIHPEGPV